MYQKQCRLSLASRYYGKGGGGGGGQQYYLRNLKKEWPAIKRGYKIQEGQYRNFRQDDPLLSRLYGRAQTYMEAPPIAGPSPLLKELQAQALEDVKRRGALSAAEEGDIRTSTLATAGAMGMGNTTGTLGTELLNREKYKTQRQDIARQFAFGTEGLTEANIGQQMAETAQKFSIPAGIFSTGIKGFSELTNPMLQYINQAFTPTGLSQTPGDNKGSAAIGAAGSVAAAAIPVIASAV